MTHSLLYILLNFILNPEPESLNHLGPSYNNINLVMSLRFNTKSNSRPTGPTLRTVNRDSTVSTTDSDYFSLPLRVLDHRYRAEANRLESQRKSQKLHHKLPTSYTITSMQIQDTKTRLKAVKNQIWKLFEVGPVKESATFSEVKQKVERITGVAPQRQEVMIIVDGVVKAVNTVPPPGFGKTSDSSDDNKTLSQMNIRALNKEQERSIILVISERESYGPVTTRDLIVTGRSDTTSINSNSIPNNSNIPNSFPGGPKLRRGQNFLEDNCQKLQDKDYQCQLSSGISSVLLSLRGPVAGLFGHLECCGRQKNS